MTSHAEQCKLVQASYVAVAKNFHDKEDLIGSEFNKIQRLELVSEHVFSFSMINLLTAQLTLSDAYFSCTSSHSVL